MTMLVAGLILFLGVHSVRILADGWRGRMVARLGESRWKGLYALASAVGFALIVWGFAGAREAPVVLWARLPWGAYLAGALMLPAMILLVGPYLGCSHINTAVRHPMLGGTVLFGVAHLLATNTLADLVLFGGFAAWAAVDLLSALARDRGDGRAVATPRMPQTLRQIAVGFALWAAFGSSLHRVLFGVSPFGF